MQFKRFCLLAVLVISHFHCTTLYSIPDQPDSSSKGSKKIKTLTVPASSTVSTVTLKVEGARDTGKEPVPQEIDQEAPEEDNADQGGQEVEESQTAEDGETVQADEKEGSGSEVTQKQLSNEVSANSSSGAAGSVQTAISKAGMITTVTQGGTTTTIGVAGGSNAEKPDGKHDLEASTAIITTSSGPAKTSSSPDFSIKSNLPEIKLKFPDISLGSKELLSKFNSTNIQFGQFSQPKIGFAESKTIKTSFKTTKSGKPSKVKVNISGT